MVPHRSHLPPGICWSQKRFNPIHTTAYKQPDTIYIAGFNSVFHVFAKFIPCKIFSSAKASFFFNFQLCHFYKSVLFVVGAQRGSEKFLNPAAAQRAAQLLGINHEDLGKDIFSPPHGTGSRLSSLFASSPIPGAIPDSTLAASPSLPRANQGVEALAAFVSGLYEHAFNALVQLINRCVVQCMCNDRTLNYQRSALHCIGI